MEQTGELYLQTGIQGHKCSNICIWEVGHVTGVWVGIDPVACIAYIVKCRDRSVLDQTTDGSCSVHLDTNINCCWTCNHRAPCEMCWDRSNVEVEVQLWLHPQHILHIMVARQRYVLPGGDLTWVFLNWYIPYFFGTYGIPISGEGTQESPDHLQGHLSISSHPQHSTKFDSIGEIVAKTVNLWSKAMCWGARLTLEGAGMAIH